VFSCSGEGSGEDDKGGGKDICAGGWRGVEGPSSATDGMIEDSRGVGLLSITASIATDISVGNLNIRAGDNVLVADEYGGPML
jgi:hypothetical protein